MSSVCATHELRLCRSVWRLFSHFPTSDASRLPPLMMLCGHASSAHPRRSHNDSILPSPTSRCVDDTHAAGPGQENCMVLMPRSRRRRCVPLFPHVDPISRKNEARG